MGRLHLVEFEDQAWLPSVIRDGLTGCLSMIEDKGEYYAPILPRLRVVLKRLECEKIVDLCSGYGGPWKHLIVPLIPFMLVSDAIVSCLRTYSLEELQMMVKEVRENHLYNWEIGIEKCNHFHIITYLIGYPETKTSIA